MAVVVAVVTESAAGERRVALDPVIARKLGAQGFHFRVQSGCGRAAGFADDAYGEASSVWPDFATTVEAADIVLKVVEPTLAEAEQLPPGSMLLSTLLPHANPRMVEMLLERRITALALEMMPRISRAQAMNTLSSQGTIAGYKAALLAAELSPRLFPMVTTPAGTVRPSNVVVIGAGIAGLQAIATARRLGARVEAYDIRPSARDQIESLGASMIDIGIEVQGTSGHGRVLNDAEKEKQVEVLAECLTRAHAVICTAALPGRSAPRIITIDMVEAMPSGAVIVDIAARSGGNCEMTKAGETVWHGNKRIVGAIDLASGASTHASELYSRNMFHLLNLLVDNGVLLPDFDDEIVRSCLLTRAGEMLHTPTAKLLGLVSDTVDNDAKGSKGSGLPAKAARQPEDNTADWVDTDQTLDNTGATGSATDDDAGESR